MRLTLVQKLLWALVGVAIVGFVWLLPKTDDGADRAQTEPEAAFRANFELTDHLGAVRTDEEFAGRWLLIFFGFANCPDVCPTTLAEVSAVMDSLGADAGQVQPLFISIDPQRDTPSALADFVPRFEAGIIGLTGTSEQIARTVDGFHVYYEKIEEAAAPGAYTMSHSSQLFLFDPQGSYMTAYPYGTPADEILADLRERFSG